MPSSNGGRVIDPYSLYKSMLMKINQDPKISQNKLLVTLL